MASVGLWGRLWWGGRDFSVNDWDNADELHLLLSALSLQEIPHQVWYDGSKKLRIYKQTQSPIAKSNRTSH